MRKEKMNYYGYDVELNIREIRTDVFVSKNNTHVDRFSYYNNQPWMLIPMLEQG
jgi:hypothetical protein